MTVVITVYGPVLLSDRSDRKTIFYNSTHADTHVETNVHNIAFA